MLKYSETTCPSRRACSIKFIRFVEFIRLMSLKILNPMLYSKLKFEVLTHEVFTKRGVVKI